MLPSTGFVFHLILQSTDHRIEMKLVINFADCFGRYCVRSLQMTNVQGRFVTSNMRGKVS